MVWITPYFNTLTGVNISSGFVFQLEQVLILLSAVFLLLLVTFLFAFTRIHFDLKRNALKPANYKFGRRIQLPAFNIFQIASSVALIICAIVIIRQMIFITEKPIGLNKQVIEVKIPSSYQQLASTFKEELEKVASIEAVSITTASPVLEHFLVLLKYNESGVEKQYSTAIFMGDENYFSTVGIQLVKGEGFSGNPSADKDKCLINESLVKQFPNQDLIGKELPGMESYTVLGIVKDFHYSSLKSVIGPGIITFNNKGGHLMVKARENQLPYVQDAIEKTWAKLIPDLPLNIESVGDRFEWFHRENKNYIQLIGACCFISIFLSMIGLFAISFQTSRFRTKEIGIRKVNGAKIWEVMLMLNMDFVKWVAIAFVIATPIAWYVMDKWLQNFAYKTQLSWWIFMLAGLLALAIALLTVSWQSWLAARRNPVEALRYE
jgi:putative ABC transport system permease protein